MQRVFLCARLRKSEQMSEEGAGRKRRGGGGAQEEQRQPRLKMHTETARRGNGLCE